MNFRPEFSRYIDSASKYNSQQSQLTQYRFAKENQQTAKYSTPLHHYDGDNMIKSQINLGNGYELPPQVAMHSQNYQNPIPDNSAFEGQSRIIDMSKFQDINQVYRNHDMNRTLDTQYLQQQWNVANSANEFDALSPIHTRTNQQYLTNAQSRQQNRQSNFR